MGQPFISIPPAYEPVSTADAESQSKLAASGDSLTGLRVQMARQWVEDLTWRGLGLRTVVQRYDGFPGVIEPHYAPLRAIVSLTYLDTAGVSQSLTSADWQVDLYSEPGRIEPAYGAVWPSTYAVQNAVTLTHRSGYAIPFTIATGTGLVTATGHWFSDGDAVKLWAPLGSTLPTGISEGTYYARDVVAGVSLKLAATSGGSAVVPTTTGTPPFFLGEIPPALRTAVLLLAAELNERRETAIVGAGMQEVVLSAERLCRPYMLRYGC